jgi:hypothetical protein
MKFAEKLSRLTADENKAKISRLAELPSNAINDYINKGYTPRVDNALALARALKVPLEWLVDDSAEWPPPETDSDILGSISDDELMFEVSKRFRPYFLDYLDAVTILESRDWSKALAYRDWQPGGPIPAEIGDLIGFLALLSQTKKRLLRYDPNVRSFGFHNRLKGKERDKSYFTDDNIRERWRALRERPGFKEARLIASALQRWQYETGEEYVDFDGDRHDPYIDNDSPVPPCRTPPASQPTASQAAPSSPAAPPTKPKRNREIKPQNPTRQPHTKEAK